MPFVVPLNLALKEHADVLRPNVNNFLFIMTIYTLLLAIRWLCHPRSLKSVLLKALQSKLAMSSQEPFSSQESTTPPRKPIKAGSPRSTRSAIAARKARTRANSTGQTSDISERAPWLSPEIDWSAITGVQRKVLWRAIKGAFLTQADFNMFLSDELNAASLEAKTAEASYAERLHEYIADEITVGSATLAETRA